jgi:predicted permease
MWSEIRLAFRTLRKSPAFTVTAVAALALGIGANTAIFSIVNALLLNPPGVAEPERVVAVRVKYDKLNLQSIPASARDFADVRDNRQLFERAAILNEDYFNYAAGGTPERLQGGRVSVEWFDVFGAKPVLGRIFTAEEDEPNAGTSVVLAYAAWQRLFGGDPSVIGRGIELDQKPFRIVGVMEPSFRWPRQVDLWVPLALPADMFTERNRFNESYLAVARTRPGVSAAEANAWLGVWTEQVKSNGTQGGAYAKDAGWGMFSVPFTTLVAGDARAPMLMLFGAVGFVLLIASANIAGLMLARASNQVRDSAIRTALGARRWDLVRQTMWEGLMLALAGATAGVALAQAGIRLLPLLAPERLAADLTVRIDPFALAFTAGIAVLSGLFFGLASAWHSHAGGFDLLKEGGRGGTAGRARQHARGTLVVAEVALALVLLVGAGLMLRSLARLQNAPTGFDPHGVMTMTMSLPPAAYKEDAQRVAFYRAVLDRLSGAPGVSSAAAGLAMPFSGMGGSASFGIEGRVDAPGDPGPHGDIRFVSAAYFTTLRIPLRGGRVFTDFDRDGTEPVVVIDENLARQYWPNESPIGRRMRNGGPRAPWYTIVGIVGHVKQSDLATDSGKGVYYYPLLQKPRPIFSFAVRTTGDASTGVATIRDAVRAVDPTLPVNIVKSMDDYVLASLAPRRFVVALLLFFAATALFLAGIGLYGLISYSVAQRTREMGIRMALGARKREVLALVVGEGLRLALIGVIVGLAAAFTLGWLLSSQLFEVSAFDPLTALSTAAALILTALIASYMPAHRATRVDPMIALRDE